ncbi:MAG TPA: alpha/beta fold hydrolase [Candidatus Limnocylindria bacterium]|nr:alpha/beta fold hydrolase [Candidatus Limnocylindria bacterium]
MRGTALEVAWIGAHLALYPLGALRDKAHLDRDLLGVAALPPVQRGLVIGDVEAAGTPILLVHGMVDNRSIFTLLRRGLRRRGFGRVRALNYSPMTDDVRHVAERLQTLVEQVCAETGYERLHVVGHSMGGMAARYYVQRLGGDQRVHTLVTLGTPHGGTFPARLVPHPLVRQLRPSSDVVTELREPAPGCRTRFVAIWSDLDQMVVPKRSATIDHPDLRARNVFVRGVGHMSLPVDGRVVHEICSTLAQLDHEGHTVVGGVTPIASTAPDRRPTRAGTASRTQRGRTSSAG